MTKLIRITPTVVYEKNGRFYVKYRKIAFDSCRIRDRWRVQWAPERYNDENESTKNHRDAHETFVKIRA